MANPVASKVAIAAAKGGDVGVAIFDLVWSTYAQNSDVIDLSSISGGLGNFQATQVKTVNGVAPTGHVVVFTPAGSPSVSNVGKVQLFAGTTELTAGAYAQTVRVTVTFAPAGLFA